MKKLSNQIDTIKVFTETFPLMPPDETTFSEIMTQLDAKAAEIHGSVSQGGLSKSHGDWFEWILAILAWNLHVSDFPKCFAFTIPNISQFDGYKLYEDPIYSMIKHLRNELEIHSGVSLVTSNPDFVFMLPSEKVETALSNPIINIDKQVILNLDSMYKEFIHKAKYGDIRCYASVKVSLRPDRRLQIPHEGSLTKALHVHLQTRLWQTVPSPLKYFAIAGSVTKADIQALKTVATHSITSIATMPHSAVDEVFAAKTVGDARDVLSQILAVASA